VDLNHDGYADYVFMNSGPTWSNRHVYINTVNGSSWLQKMLLRILLKQFWSFKIVSAIVTRFRYT
jgi:hypothetical protein